ncbi:MAG: hypothetical protein PHR20_01100, partial [Bacteroidales bacterium]|nr:hypothetical protein [Bacteroidales bacterium]
MSNKSNRSLTAGIIILVLLAVIVTLRYTVFKTKSERNFNGIVNELPIEAVDRIEIKLPGEQLVVLNRADDIWTV